jgi:hypothetical protein
MKRRKYLLLASSTVLPLAGCSELTDSGPEETRDEMIDAKVEDVIVKLNDLEAGWSGELEEGGDYDAVYFTDDVTIEITVEEFSDIGSAENGYDKLMEEETQNTATDDVDYGNDGFLANPFEGFVLIGFRAGNFVFGVYSTATESAMTDPEDPAKDMAEIMIDKVADIQSR